MQAEMEARWVAFTNHELLVIFNALKDQGPVWPHDDQTVDGLREELVDLLTKTTTKGLT